ncbi:hypothetical protein HPP92_012753 [Vanilla planifolia]|uniref:Sodium/calcium exchanger membrane region domain-containing protein n=1 Tax=Vanilla planifolia TaxID=51239 RepID=A0A835QXF5_VANPL|nr:hypothetical protein HPP92_012753 [Vanilla planifolia]
MANTTPASLTKALLLHLSFLITLLVLLFAFTSLRPQPRTNPFTANNFVHHIASEEKKPCDLRQLETIEAKCKFLSSSGQCNPQGYMNYLHFFYCISGNYQVLGLSVLFLCLVLLFHILGTTAATCFCSTLEGLSRDLKLSPAIAGTTLLSLGNGAPDVFSSIASFEASNTVDVGLNSVLGGALFVSTIVVGVVSIFVSSRQVAVDKLSFVRDSCFLLVVLLALTAILLSGTVTVPVAVGFALLYLIYIFLVYITSLLYRIGKKPEEEAEETVTMTLSEEKNAEQGIPLLSNSKQPKNCCQVKLFCRRLLRLLELPLSLPRRLTIPEVSEARWSKPFAVASATFSPVLLATLWGRSLKAGLVGALVGLLIGCVGFFSTETDRPPTRFRLVWLAGGFLMSVTWTYATAAELVSLVVSLGTILGISPALLGLTVLAWGDSLGDLIAAVAVVRGGPDGAQVVLSGCYAGPTFNTLMGLGLPMVLLAWKSRPSPAAVVVDTSVLEMLGFMAGGLLWALLMLLKRGMKPDGVLGGGLIAIYLCFMCIRLLRSSQE